MIRSGARRLLVILLVLVAAALAAALVGMALGSSVGRSLALGFYFVGSLAGFIGFALGSRGLFRPRHLEEGTGTAGEADDSRAVAGLLMIAGVVLVRVGVAVDPRTQLV